MTDVFISYAHEDHAYVRIMAPALEAEGFTVWWDHTIPPGKTWDEVIAKGIADARCCIVLWSQSSVVSDWVKEEATIAKDHRKFIPVQIDNSEPPVGFRRIQAAHLQNWTGNVNEPQWQMLVREIRGVITASRESGAPSSGGPAQPYTPRAYQPITPPPAQPRSGPPPLAIGAMAVAALVAVAAIVVNVIPRGAPATAPPSTLGTEVTAEAPSLDPGLSAEIERLRRERDAAVAGAERERLQRELDQANAARLAENRRIEARLAEDRRRAEAARLAEEQRRIEAARPSVNLSGTTWNMRRRFTNTEPRTWADVGVGTFRSGGEYFSQGSTDGYWRVSGSTLTFGFAGGNQTTYTATLRANRMTGTFRNVRGEEGEFEITMGAPPPAVNLAGSTWRMRRRFTNTEPRTWSDVGVGTFRSGGEYYSQGSTDGYWRVSGSTLTFGFAGGNQTTYTGTLRSDRMTGTFRNVRGEEGEFEITRE